MNRIVFVTTELQPETPGGAGVAVDALARGLADEHECVVLLLTSEPVDVTPREGVTVIQATIPEAGFVERSQAAAGAVSAVVQPGDRVEFQDFEGIAFHALASRSQFGLDRSLATVRFHGTYDMIVEATETPPPGLEVPIGMEREVLAMADLVLVATAGQHRIMTDRYGVEEARIAVAPLPVPPIAGAARRPDHPPIFSVVGRLDERKGPQDVVRAAVRLLDRGNVLRVRFIGLDGWSPTNGTPMSEWLVSLMADHRDAFEFVGPLPRHRLGDAIADSLAVIVPSRFETFCYVAHEARQLGHPVIVADLKVFDDLFDKQTGSLVYDGSPVGLARAMKKLIRSPRLGDRLASAPAPDPGDPWSAYRMETEIRHPRTQAGRGTTATQNLERLMTTGPEAPPRTGIRRLIRFIPPPLVNVAYRVIPRPIQKKLARHVSWTEETSIRRLESLPPTEAPGLTPGQEEMIRATRERIEAMGRRIDAGEFPEIADPQITVVIPVFNEVGYLDETLTSVFEQTFDSWEIVVVDDGSTSPEAREYFDSLSRPRLRLIRQKNKGLPGARNAGIEAARGQYVIPLDGDDQLKPTYMETMLKALSVSPEAAYAHCYAVLHHDVDAIWVTRPFNPYWQLLGNGVFGCALIRKDALDAVGGYNTTMRSGNEDWELWLRFMANGWDQVQVREPLVMYRKHGVSMSVTTESQFEEGRRQVRDLHRGLYEGLADKKREWYPMITVIRDTVETTGNVDFETVTSMAELERTWGKYVVDLRGVAAVSDETLLAMAVALEDQPEIARAVSAGEPPLILTRRWNLHDSTASPQGDLIVDIAAQGSGEDLPTHIPRSGWAPPPLDDDEWRPIQRQAPEEEGRLPDVWEW